MRMMNLSAIGFIAGLAAAGAARAAEPEAGAPAALPPQVVHGVVKAPIAEVWRVFSTAEGFKKLGVAKCEMDFRVGGLIRSHYKPDGVIGDLGTIQNEILAYEPERMLAFHIAKPPEGFPFGESTWKSVWTVATLTDLGDGQTDLRLAGIGYADTEDGRKMRDFFEAGNGWVLKHLQQQYDTSVETPKGAAHAIDPLRPIVHERVAELPRADVWSLLATSEGWKKALGADAEIELRPGGKFEIHFNPAAPAGQQGSEGCTVLSLVPEEMLSCTWNAPPKFAHARAARTWVVIRFDELSPGRTRVRLDHRGFAEQAAENPDHRAEWEQVREYFQKAWEKVLDGVKSQENKR